jgi:hypothetical protein
MYPILRRHFRSAYQSYSGVKKEGTNCVMVKCHPDGSMPFLPLKSIDRGGQHGRFQRELGTSNIQSEREDHSCGES